MEPPPPSDGAQLSDVSRIIRLQAIRLSKEDQKRKGFVLEPLSQAQIEGKRRCLNCKRAIGVQKRKPSIGDDSAHCPTGGATSEGQSRVVQKPKPSIEPRPRIGPRPSIGPRLSIGDDSATSSTDGAASDGKSKVDSQLMPICRFHQGSLKENKWTCCGQKPGNRGCVGYLQHMPRACSMAELLDTWQFSMTPSQDGKWCRPAVAIDCEMGVNYDGNSELIRVSVVDYLTSDILLDHLVFPKNLRHPNQKYSGVAWRDLHEARMRGNCFFHRKDALRAVWGFVGPDTVVVGHSVNNDLMALRWIHNTIVDTFFLEKEEHELQTKAGPSKSEGVSIPTSCSLPEELKKLELGEPAAKEEPKEKKEKGSGILSLKSVIESRLGRSIRRNDKHDSVEDAMAARDIAEWHANNRSKTL